MQIIETKISGLVIVEPRIFTDARGYFFESFSEKAFAAAGLPSTFVQDNQSCSEQGTLRGLHFQTAPYGQGKLVRVLSGSIFDVAVDIRPGSATYGQWVGVTLDAITHQMLYVPAGFAHGFYVTSPEAVVSYKCTTPYHPTAESGIRWDDPDVKVAWPLVAGAPLIVSEKDKQWEGLTHVG
jgi:dTDP-4-dehydrorhamnose 3,5-epimerase